MALSGNIIKIYIGCIQRIECLRRPYSQFESLQIVYLDFIYFSPPKQIIGAVCRHFFFVRQLVIEAYIFRYVFALIKSLIVDNLTDE